MRWPGEPRDKLSAPDREPGPTEKRPTDPTAETAEIRGPKPRKDRPDRPKAPGHRECYFSMLPVSSSFSSRCIVPKESAIACS